MIILENVSKVFKDNKNCVHALSDVSVTINSGDIYGIVGFSGAGKSTLIRCINLLERPSSGNVYFKDQNLVNMKNKELRNLRKKMGMIFQHFNLMASRTVAQNIAFPLTHSGLDKKQINAKIEELLELVDLKDKKNVYPSALSGGQKQRVAIARALANDPDVLLCDEATSALDPQTTKSILRLLKEVNKKMKVTIVLITHEMSVIKEICDRVAVMELGKIVEEGNIADVFCHPKESVTKNFINGDSIVERMHDMLNQHPESIKMHKGEKMMALNYDGVNTSEALISEISRKFNVNINIVFGNVEIIKDTPFGDLIVIMGGKQEDIDKSIVYLNDNHVNVEVLEICMIF